MHERFTQKHSTIILDPTLSVPLYKARYFAGYRSTHL